MLVCSEQMKCIFKLLSEQFLISSCFDITKCQIFFTYISYYSSYPSSYGLGMLRILNG